MEALEGFRDYLLLKIRSRNQSRADQSGGFVSDPSGAITLT
jgi:hypothetical protein